MTGLFLRVPVIYGLMGIGIGVAEDINGVRGAGTGKEPVVTGHPDIGNPQAMAINGNMAIGTNKVSNL